ncbi:leucine-rich repeat protein, partial [Candidatus Saccharibacteria bacterium]|nr:leucine-rich repeat protein [Candidatus Saccharibacteria bacterium]
MCFTTSVWATRSSDDGIFTDSNDVRWEYNHVVDTETTKEAITIRFFDKPANLTTIAIPSLQDVIAGVPNASQTLDTYFLDDANDDYQDAHYSETKRNFGSDVTKLDMSNTSKIQIVGIRPMLNPDVETELIFGPNMVIGNARRIDLTIDVCSRFTTDQRWWTCVEYKDYTATEQSIPFWALLTEEEKENYLLTAEEYAEIFGLDLKQMAYDSWSRDYVVPYSTGDPDPNTVHDYYTGYFNTGSEGSGGGHMGDGVFSGYKLKLTYFGEFNYVGWNTFKDSVLNESNTTITISGDGFVGKDIFANTNVRKAIIETNLTGEGLFRNCSNLTEIEFADNVDTVGSNNFAGTNLGQLDLSVTNIKTIKEKAFEDCKITSVNLGDVETVLWEAFRNNDITNLYMPKSINFLGVSIFKENYNLEKVTIAYDTMTIGTVNPFFVDYLGESYFENQIVKEIELIAPYAADEPVKPTHLSYDDYRWNYNDKHERISGDRSHGRWGSNSIGVAGFGYGDNTGLSLGAVYKSEDDYAKVDEKKNIVAPNYFRGMMKLQKLVIGEGYEYIGATAFYKFNTGGEDSRWGEPEEANCELILPSTLKGIGTLAFDSRVFQHQELPESLEFIGIGAFRGAKFVG